MNSTFQQVSLLLVSAETEHGLQVRLEVQDSAAIKSNDLST